MSTFSLTTVNRSFGSMHVAVALLGATVVLNARWKVAQRTRKDLDADHEHFGAYRLISRDCKLGAMAPAFLCGRHLRRIDCTASALKEAARKRNSAPLATRRKTAGDSQSRIRWNTDESIVTTSRNFASKWMKILSP